MTDVFLSYSSKDRGGENDDGTSREDRVSRIVELLEGQGFNVFWDQKVPPGVDWDEWIRKKLKDAKCAVVLWSKYSIQSKNVRHEATIAQKYDKLVSVLIDALDAEQFPMGLYTHQAVLLSGWSGDDDDELWQNVLSEVEAKHAPHAPLWVQRALHGLEADLAAERTRVKSAESRAREIERKLGKGAEVVLEAERDRDSALEEAAAAKAKLAESVKARAELAAQLAGIDDRVRKIEGERDKALKEAANAAVRLTEKDKVKSDAEARLNETQQKFKEVEAERDSLSVKLKETEDALAEANRQLADPKRKRAPVTPGARGGPLYVFIALAIASISMVALSETLSSVPPSMRPLFWLGFDASIGASFTAGAFVVGLLMLLIRRRRLGSAEFALYWLALMPPIAIVICALVAAGLVDGYQWLTESAFLFGFVVGWLFLLLTARFFATRRGPGLTAAALFIYWLGLAVPILATPLANHVYADRLALPGFYFSPNTLEDYSGYIIALILVLASGLLTVRWWGRRNQLVPEPAPAA